MIVGGIASRLAGDKFANGATSAAFAYLFNDLGAEMHNGTDPAPARPESLDKGKKLGEVQCGWPEHHSCCSSSEVSTCAGSTCGIGQGMCAMQKANISIKFALFGRWTPQKRGAPYLGR